MSVTSANALTPEGRAASLGDSPVAASRPRRMFGASFFSALAPWIVPALLLIAWQVGARSGWISPRILPAPEAVFNAAVHLTRTGELPRDIAVSAGRALLGFAIGGSLGFLLGLLNGAWPVADKALDTTVQMIRTIPNLAMIPLVILWFGIGEEAKICLVALGVFFPCT